MRWVYILKCEDDYYYVGETQRLFRRFWEHESGDGSLNTFIHKPEQIVAIYKVNVIYNFVKYNNLVNDFLNKKLESYKIIALQRLNFWDKDCDETNWYGHGDNLIAENNIAECLMIHNKDNWNKIRGGKYTRFNVEYKYPNNDYIKDLPLCNCGMPCDIRKNEDNNYLYFRCAKKNMWDTFRDMFDIEDDPCKFFMEYKKDSDIRLEHEERIKMIKELYKKSYHWLQNIEIYNGIDDYDEDGCIECGESRLKQLLSRYDKKIRLCFDCFIKKNDELSKKYNHNSVGKCLLNYKKGKNLFLSD